MKRVMIFSGAGLSAESGLRTFRDSDGLWEEYDVMEVCSVKGFAKNPQKVLGFYDERRIQLGNVQPNAAHNAIAALQQKFGKQVQIITQNVDDLLERAGCSDVIHVHGFLPEIYCTQCGDTRNIGYTALRDRVCKACGSESMRHNIVMFGEFAPHYATLDSALQELKTHDGLLVCIGTSGEVINIAQFTPYATKSVLNNLESSWLDRYFDVCFIEPASRAAPKITALIHEFLA